MLTIYKTTEQGLVTVDDAAAGCWLHVVAPTSEELARLERAGIPPEFLTHALDLDERPRTERDDSGALLIILLFPYARGPEHDIPYVTVPLSIIITETLIVTVVPFATGLLQKFIAGHVRGLSTGKKSRFILHLLWHIANQYLVHLREIDAAVDRVEDRLQRSLRNREVLELLKYQKSLVYFTTALKSNELVLDRLQKGQLLQHYPEDDELLEDVLIEVRQAIEITSISENILSQMMDAFASIISNNLNVVMKFLASVTIILSLPTLIARVYGMNVPLPGEDSPLTLVVILAGALLLSLVVVFVFWRRDWL
jgi:magnesium transporter